MIGSAGSDCISVPVVGAGPVVLRLALVFPVPRGQRGQSRLHGHNRSGPFGQSEIEPRPSVAVRAGARLGPGIYGKGIANPIAMIRTGALMLDFLAGKTQEPALLCLTGR